MTESDPIPVTGAWRPGDEPGRRQFVSLFADEPLALRAGGALSPVDVAYETWGTLSRDGDNAVLLLHALTGDTHARGPVEPGHPQLGWWDPLVGPGRAVDTDRFFVVCPNVLGGCQGTTGPASTNPATSEPYGSRFPVITIRDQVRVEAALADALGIDAWAAVIGGSMGGMRALEWSIMYPDRIPRVVLLACGAAATAEQIALCSLQIRAIEADRNFAGGDYYGAAEGPWQGMSIARGIGQVSYRSELELQQRFNRGHQNDEHPFEGGFYTIESYLDYHGEKLAHRFDANSYVVLSRAMNHHDIGRGRGGVADALGRIVADVTIGGISSDRLYPLRLQHELADLIPRNKGVVVVQSIAGHDGFLTEHEAIGDIVAGALA
jgi:homoserine O-acetyltransferase/O-succinyltransferase